MTTSLTTFFSAWSEPDTAARRALIEASAAADLRYSDPRSGSTLHGVDAINAYVGNFSASAPGWSATVEAADTCNGFVRVVVAFGGPGPDGAAMVQHGTYFAELDDAGKLRTLAGFVGTAPRTT